MEKCLRFLKSYRLALTLMIIIFLYILAAFYAGGAIDNGITLYSNALFVTLLFLLSFSILLCTFYRIKRLLLPLKGLPPLQEKAISLHIELTLLEKEFKSRGYVTETDGDQVLTATKGNASPWGSIAFHCGIVVILAGFCLSALLGMSAWVIIPEGVVVSFPNDLADVQRGSLHQFENDYFVGLKEVIIPVSNGQIEQIRGYLEFFEGSYKAAQWVEVNQPGKYKGCYWRSQDWGYSAEIVITDSKKRVVFKDYLNIGSQGDSFFDTFTLPGGLNILVEFQPGADAEGGQAEIRPEKPSLKVALKKDGKDMGGQIIPIHEGRTVGQYFIEFSGHRFWEKFDVSQDPGENLIFVGGFMVVAGFAVRVLINGKRVWLKLEQQNDGCQIKWAAKADYFNSNYQVELANLLQTFGGRQ